MSVVNAVNCSFVFVSFIHSVALSRFYCCYYYLKALKKIT